MSVCVCVCVSGEGLRECSKTCVVPPEVGLLELLLLLFCVNM